MISLYVCGSIATRELYNLPDSNVNHCLDFIQDFFPWVLTLPFELVQDCLSKITNLYKRRIA